MRYESSVGRMPETNVPYRELRFFNWCNELIEFTVREWPKNTTAAYEDYRNDWSDEDDPWIATVYIIAKAERAAFARAINCGGFARLSEKIGVKPSADCIVAADVFNRWARGEEFESDSSFDDREPYMPVDHGDEYLYTMGR